MNGRINQAVFATAAIVVAAIFAIFVPPAPAHAWGGGTTISGGGTFNGGTLTSGITFSGSAGISFDSASTGGISIRDSAPSLLFDVGIPGNSYFSVRPSEPRVRTSFASLQISNAFLDLAPADLTVSTTTTPTAGFVRISAAGAVAWTPASPGTAAGSVVVACSVDASHTITMTDGATYEGSGCALAVNDCVTMIYDPTTTKWRELSCNNN